MAVTIELQGWDKLQAALKNYPTVAPGVFASAINAALTAVEAQTMDESFQFKTPRDLRTGGLRNSFAFGRRLATPSSLVGSIGPTVDYAKFVEYGTKPHLIVAKNARVLANKKTGQIFGKVVHHPGSAANPFMERIASKAQPAIDSIMAQGLAKVVASLAN